jgi:hypothetical protein
VPPALENDEEWNAQEDEDKYHEEEGDDGDDKNFENPKKGAPCKPGRPRKEESVRKKRKRGRPKKEEPPTPEEDDDDYQGKRQRKMLKTKKNERERPRKMVNGTKSDGPRMTKMPKAITRAPVALLKSKPQGELRREPGVDIGSIVYAKWLNGNYYWAIIVDVKRKLFSHFDQYSVRTTV